MADEPIPAEPTEVAKTPAPAEPTPAEPTKHTHSQRILRVAAELGISQDEAERLDTVALRQEIADAQIEAQLRQQRQPKQQPQPATPAEEPDEEFQVPEELQAELADVSPAIIKLIKLTGKEALKAKKVEKQLQQLRQDQANREVQAAVVRALDQLPQAVGSKAARDNAVFNELVRMSQAGELRGQSVEQHVREAYANLYGAETPKPAAAPAPARKPATPTARPTNRLNPVVQGQLDHLDGNSADDYVP